MIKIENKNWEPTTDSIFNVTYIGQIITNSWIDEELTQSEQVQFVSSISDSFSSIHTIALEVDEFLPNFTLTLTMESESRPDALRKLCQAAVSGWMAVDKDAECLEYRIVHLISEPDLEDDRQDDPLLNINSPKYTVELVDTIELDDYGEPVILEMRDFFYMTREDLLEA